MKKLLAFLGVLAVLFLGFLAYAATRPPDYHVERSLVIKASPEELYTIVSDFRNFDKWSPWAELDPDMKKEFSGAESGVGAIYTWAGNNDVGEGRMTIEEATPGEIVSCKLEFLKPFEATSITSWRLVPESDGTRFVWTMDGKNETLMAKVFGVLMDMDSAVGADFERGLGKLKSLAESS